MRRSAEEIKARCLLILNDERIVSLIKASSSPSAAYEMVSAETKDVSACILKNSAAKQFFTLHVIKDILRLKGEMI